MAPPNVKIKHLIRSSSGNSRFPKLDECAHFHYENVELGPIKVVLCDKQTESSRIPSFVNSSSNKENEVVRFCFLVLVVSNNRKWVVRRTYNDFVFLDTQLHRCVYDRKYSLLRELPSNISQDELENEFSEENVRTMLAEYLERFSQLAGSLITCGPVLNWHELDNRGNRLIVTDEVAINTPAVAAAYVVMRHTAQAADEISFDVGDMISVIDMPPPEESTWWRGKRGFEVGFFPSECVEVIGDKVPRGFKLSNASTKPVFRKHGKLIAFFRSFLLSRPSRRKLKQSGILKERVFGCDLAEHLLNTAREIPLVLKCCTEFIEEHGVVDGIYRLSGVSSNIQRLRNAFDEDCATNLGDPTIAQDIHSVASLLKMYFRELPNPLLTYQLYDKFVSAVQSSEDVRLLRIRDVVQQLPPPHYRTLQYLLAHLARVASFGEQTGMTPKNIAIVWAPNLLRSREVENGGVGALHVVGVQAVLTEYLIRYCDLIFDEKVPTLSSIEHDEGIALRTRPKSLAISTPTKLLSLEEARARALSTHLPLTQQKYIDVGGGPENLPPQYHTVIDLPSGKPNGLKLKKSPSGWKSFFSRGWYSGSTRDKSRQSLRSSRKSSTASLPHTSTQLQERVSTSSDAPYRHQTLRTVKSAESLIQCSKDSSPISDKEYKPGISQPSSPEASMDSSYSFDVGSPLSKSPSLQKHTRSSSHESYFDNSMDMMSSPPVEEEEHSLFYYVNEQMQKLQQTGSPLAWYTQFDASDSVDHMLMSSTYQDKSPSSTHAVHLCQSDATDTEKVIRKQKLEDTEDFAQAKVQRLSWMENKHESSPPSTVDGTLDINVNEVADTPSSESCNMNESKPNESVPELEDTSFWLPRSDQAVFCKLSGNHKDGYQLDPYAFYDCVIDKRASAISSSDNDIDSSAKTVIERYGNAETVLVEVHATQDSSSEGELESLKITPLGIEFLPAANEAIDDVFARVMEQVGEEREEDDDETSGNIAKESFAPSSNNENVSENDDFDISDFYYCQDSDMSIVVPSTLDFKSDDDDDDNTLNSPIKESSMNDILSTSSIAELPCSVSPKVEKSNKSPNKNNLCLKLSPNLTETMCFDTTTNLEDTDSYIQSQKIKSPPSPIYPPKSTKQQDVHTLQTKIENIPFPKKRQLVNIPSPSSPIEEVRKKFERASSVEKTKETTIAHTKTSPKDVPSKLTLKQKQLFETKDSSHEISDIVKRKSDGLISSSKSDISHKRKSEPPPNISEIPSPSEKDKKLSPKQPSSLSSTSNLSSSISDIPVSKQKSSQPSLFTQLKVRKLQSLQGQSPTSSKPIDPWSDPILDMQEEYHPVVSYPEYTSVYSSPTTDVSTSEPSSPLLEPIELESDEQDSVFDIPESMVTSEILQADKAIDDTPTVLPPLNTDNENDSEKTNPSFKNSDIIEDETVKRERINRIKEERRAQLREKLKPESLRLDVEEKDKVQTKFRLRKDSARHNTETTDDKIQEKSFNPDTLDSKDSLESDSTSISKNHIKSLDRTTTKKPDSCSESPVLKRTSTSLETSSGKCDSPEFSSTPKTVLPSCDESQKSNSLESRSSWSSNRRSSDIRDKVAIFERSKDTQESCRLGPNGKFPQKPGASSLTSSFVR